MDNKNVPAVIDAEFNAASPETAVEPDVVVLERDESKSNESVHSGPGSVAVKTGDVTIGTGDIKNDKSVGEGMQESGGTVNMTVNNDNSKTTNKIAPNRFASAASMQVPTVAEAGDKSMEM